MRKVQSDLYTLIIIAQAAHQTGNRRLELAARCELREAHGVNVKFARQSGEQ